jgi:hypothetical protein
MPPVMRQDALRIAEDYLKAHPRPNCDGIEKVFIRDVRHVRGRVRRYGAPGSRPTPKGRHSEIP